MCSRVLFGCWVVLLSAQSIAEPCSPTEALQSQPSASVPQPPKSGDVSLLSLQDLDAAMARLSQLMATIRSYDYPNGRDARGHTLQQDVDEYLLPPANQSHLSMLHTYAEAENSRGDGTSLRRTLDEAQTILEQESFRARVLLQYAQVLRMAQVHQAAWVAYADRVSAERRAASEQHVDAAATAYAGAVERALQSGRSEQLGGIEQTTFLAETLLAAYNKERGDLAAELTEADRERGKLLPPFVRTAPCPAATARTSGRATPYYDQMLRDPNQYYPLTARQIGFEGGVMLQVTVSETGCLERVEILQSSGVSELDQAALKWASEAITFLPAERDRKAVAATAKVPVKFSLH
jgi:TonB family protein